MSIIRTNLANQSSEALSLLTVMFLASLLTLQQYTYTECCGNHGKNRREQENNASNCTNQNVKSACKDSIP